MSNYIEKHRSDKGKIVSNSPVKKETTSTSIRISDQLQDKIAQAAALSGMSKTSLMKTGIEQYVESIIEKTLNEDSSHKFLVLNNENFRRFSEALEKPPAPNQALIDFMSKSAWKKQ